jgi:glycosyltransferase involved in cell wall biosynthesis
VPSGASYDVQVLLPIHNEAESIEATIEGLYRDLSSQVSLQFLLCEDGSKDNTKEILRGVNFAA